MVLFWWCLFNSWDLVTFTLCAMMWPLSKRMVHMPQWAILPYHHLSRQLLSPPTNHYLLSRLISIANKTYSKNSDGGSSRRNRTELTNDVSTIGTECSKREVADEEEVSNAYNISNFWLYLKLAIPRWD